MMTNQRRTTLVATLFIVAVAWSSAFAPAPRVSLVVSPSRVNQRASFMASLPLYMSKDTEEKKTDESGNYYDDEVSSKGSLIGFQLGCYNLFRNVSCQ